MHKEDLPCEVRAVTIASILMDARRRDKDSLIRELSQILIYMNKDNTSSDVIYSMIQNLKDQLEKN